LKIFCQICFDFENFTRYFFGLNVPGGLCRDFSDEKCIEISETLWEVLDQFKELHNLLRFTSSFLDRLEDVGIVSKKDAVSYGLVGPVARASGIAHDLRMILPYAGYGNHIKFHVPKENQGDGYARLRVLFNEIEQSINIIRQISHSLPSGPVRQKVKINSGFAVGRAEAPTGAAFHFLKTDEKGRIIRYHIMSPSFANWHGFHIAAENFAFQDFPIIMATFGLSNAENDR
jgi:Ni,Fe-hydrogenase III large subunit